jgi:hypothetical protein
MTLTAMDIAPLPSDTGAAGVSRSSLKWYRCCSELTGRITYQWSTSLALLSGSHPEGL